MCRCSVIVKNVKSFLATRLRRRRWADGRRRRRPSCDEVSKVSGCLLSHYIPSGKRLSCSLQLTEGIGRHRCDRRRGSRSVFLKAFRVLGRSSPRVKRYVLGQSSSTRVSDSTRKWAWHWQGWHFLRENPTVYKWYGHLIDQQVFMRNSSHLHTFSSLLLVGTICSIVLHMLSETRVEDDCPHTFLQ